MSASREEIIKSGVKQIDKEQAEIKERLSGIKHKLLVLSGKGGVGKSTVSTFLALMLANSGKRVGLLDVDIHGPSIPSLLNIEESISVNSDDTLNPVEKSENLKVMSVGFLLKQKDTPVIWRGPKKFHLIKQFLKEVEWGNLDYLIVDSPPGTGDEPMTIGQFLNDADGALIVTTPQKVAVSDVRKCIMFCRKIDLNIVGVIENMSGLVCPECGAAIDVFKSGGGEDMAENMDVPFLGRIPMDAEIVRSCDSGWTPDEMKVLSESNLGLVKVLNGMLAGIGAERN